MESARTARKNNDRRTDHDKEISVYDALFSAVYIAVEADHDCSGEDCAICHQIGVCENLLKSLGLAGAAAAISAAFTYTVCKAILPCTEMIGTLTLVSLKVKLSN